jgi:pyridoxine kinase
MAAYTIDPKPPYVLAISSYAVHGVASLKIFIRVLGSAVLPVPSLVLGGLTNIEGIKKFDISFAELLENTLQIAVLRKQQLVFYTGYLGSPEQADVVSAMINKYRNNIKTVITDPVCGDNGRTYVSPAVINKWPRLIKLSDFVSPNITELKLMTGHAADAADSIDTYIDQFKELYPDTQLMISSYAINDQEIGIQLHSGSDIFEYGLPVLPKNFGGSGDLLLALFMRERFYNNLSVEDALQAATDITHRIIQFSIDNASDELLLNDQILNNQLP